MSEDKNWYVLRVISGKERKIKDYLDMEISRSGWSDIVTQILVPTEKVYKLKGGKKVIQERNFFPGYIMIKANLSGEIPHIIKSITNVIGF